MPTQSTQIATKLRNVIRKEFQVSAVSDRRYAVYSPFTFDDGDSFVVNLIDEDGKWLLTDEGNTLMHLSYTGVDVSQGQRRDTINNALAMHSIENRGGELVIDNIPYDMVGYRVLSFIHAVEKLQSVTKWTTKAVRSTFAQDLDLLVRENVESSKWEKNWFDPDNDPDSLYMADYKIRGRETWLVFGISSNIKCYKATVACLKGEDFGWNVKTLAVFEDQTTVDRKSLAMLTDACDKQFSSLGSKRKIAGYLKQISALAV